MSHLKVVILYEGPLTCNIENEWELGNSVFFPCCSHSEVRSLWCFMCMFPEAALESAQKQRHLSCKLWAAQITFSI